MPDDGDRHDHAHRARDRRALSVALVLVVAFMVFEIAAGIVSDSLAVLADAGHMLSDASSLALALGAVWLAGRPATTQRSFGYRRAEILAALVNGVLLVVIAIWIFVEAARRFEDPPDVLGGWVLVVGCTGLAVNLAAAWILSRGGSGSLNMRGALLHVLADALGSAGVIVAGIVVLGTGWDTIDPVVSVVIGVLILASSWSILKESVNVLLEATPSGMSAQEVGRAIVAVDEVLEVHDLHIWTITSGFSALSAHVLVEPGADCHGLRRQIEGVLRERFALEHTTLQVDHAQVQGPATVAFGRADGLNTRPCP
jgi:cobalt-zinc-cadmium efflux system protein